MKYILVFILLGPMTGFCQKDIHVISASYWSYLKEYETSSLDAVDNPSPACFGDVVGGAKWFKLKNVDLSQLQIQFLSESKYGKISDYVWIAVFEQKPGAAQMRNIYCSRRVVPPASAAAKIKVLTQIVNMDLRNDYFICIGSEKQGKSFTLRTAQMFVANTAIATTASPYASETAHTIIGRLSDGAGQSLMDKKIMVANKDGDLLYALNTDNDGMFKFTRLSFTEQLFVMTLEDDVRLDVFRVTGTDKVMGTKVEEGVFGFDIKDKTFNQFNLLSEIDWVVNPETGTFGVTGRVVDKNSRLFGQEGIEVNVYDKQKSLLGRAKTNKNGEFKIKDLPSTDVNLEVEVSEDHYMEVAMVDDLNVPVSYTNSDKSAGKNFSFEKLPTDNIRMQQMEVRDMQMKLTHEFDSLSAGHAVTLRNVFFESNSSTLLASSYESLDNLAHHLIIHPELKMLVKGHTDNIGDRDSNMKLSEDRAMAVKQYLVSHDILPDRISIRGVGYMQPVADNDTPAGRKKNRRVEVIASH